jgi:hypothetical protein
MDRDLKKVWLNHHIGIMFHCVRSMWPEGHLDLDHEPGKLYKFMCDERKYIDELIEQFLDGNREGIKEGIIYHIDRMFDQLRTLYPEGYLDLRCKSGKIYKLMCEERKYLNNYLDIQIKRGESN